MADCLADVVAAADDPESRVSDLLSDKRDAALERIVARAPYLEEMVSRRSVAMAHRQGFSCLLDRVERGDGHQPPDHHAGMGCRQGVEEEGHQTLKIAITVAITAPDRMVHTDTIATLDTRTETPGALGLSIAEDKGILLKLQQDIVTVPARRSALSRWTVPTVTMPPTIRARPRPSAR